MKTLTLAAALAVALSAVPANANPLEDPFHEYLVQVPLEDGRTLCLFGGERFFESFQEQDAGELAEATVFLADDGEPCPAADHAGH